ncbi:uncharacterized protein A4U43_C03F6600 [Asparagus officinalis]|uniref:Uncharacterized protein n=1 Tax=Asparagus officinalis TaxID=4686 RepID=A0A5P1FC94_ASPOF|nr:uncharacterized protein A4U43_C03F6600 [Asparagus officinalis]
MEEEENCSKLEEALEAFEPPIDMSQNIDIDEDENLDHAFDEHLQTQTQNTQETSINSEQPLPSNKSEESCPESYCFL